MGRLNITEYSSVGRFNGSPVLVGEEPSIKSYNLEVGQQSVVTSNFAPSAAFVRLVADCDVRVHIAASPEATQDCLLLLAGEAEYFAVQPGKALKLAAVEAI